VVLENDFSGAGGALNVKANYYIGYGFSLYGLGKIALYTATVDIKNQEEIDIIDQRTNALTPIYFLRQNALFNMKSNFLINLGGEWGRQLVSLIGLKVSLSYEFNYWPNQIGLLQLIYDQDTQAVVINQFSDVSFQGISLRAILNF
jgi:hypothetical protein